MAEIKSGILGKVSGTIGNITGRIRRGKNIISVKPSSYTPPMDEDSVLRRNRFKCDVQFSKAVIHLSDLKQIWAKNISGNMSAFNLVMQTNYKYLKNNCPTASNIIVPTLGFPLSPVKIELEPSTLNVTLSPIGNLNSFNPETDKYIKLYSVIYLSSPKEEEMEADHFISCKSAKADFQTTTQLVFSIPLDVSEIPLVQNYNTVHIYIAAVTLDQDEYPQKYSITLYQ